MDDPHAEVEIKPQLKPRDSVAKEEDPKLSHQLYKLWIKSTRSTRQTLCLWNIFKKTLRALKKKTKTKMHPLVLKTLEIGGKNTQE